MIHQAKGEEPHDAFRFNASRWDAGSGTYDMGFRNYDPGLNRFLTRDAAAKLAKTGKKIADGIDTVKDVEKGVEATVDANKALPTNTPKPKTETPTKPKCNSFVPGTRVLLSDGSSKPIEEVKVGDRVLAADVESGDRQSRPVTQLIKGDGVKKLVTIVVDTDGKAGGKNRFLTRGAYGGALADMGLSMDPVHG